MPKKDKIKCVQCGAVEFFEDEVDIRYSKWIILAWNVGTGDPVCLCSKCEWKPVGKNENTNHKANSPKIT